MVELTITLYTKKGRQGSKLLTSQYKELAQFILMQLKTNTPISINQLLDLAFKEFPHDDRNKFARTLLQVKGDLEARGLIKIFFSAGRSQLIQLKRKRNMVRY
jgi:hypothetical protein